MSPQTFVDAVDVQEQEAVEHPRVAIRKRVKMMLQALVPAIDDRIFISRELPLKQIDFPNILIFTEGDSLISRLADNPIQERRQVQLVISVGHVASALEDEELQDAVDRFMHPLEQMMIDNPELGGLVEDTVYSNSDVSIESAGEGIFLFVRSVYNVTYYRDQGPMLGENKLSIGGVGFEISDDNEFVEMEDIIDFEAESEAAA